MTAAHSKHAADHRSQLSSLQQQALGWLLDTAVPVYRPQRHDALHVLNKVRLTSHSYEEDRSYPSKKKDTCVYVITL